MHLTRSNNYEKELKEFTDVINPTDIVVLDGYNFGTDYQKKVKSCCHKLVCIDDKHASHFVASDIINHAGGVSAKDYSTEAYTKLCLGSKYALLRKPFLEAAKKTARVNPNNNLFICFGGADLYNLTCKTLKTSLKIGEWNEIHIVTGSAFKHQFELEKLINGSEKNEIYLHKNLSAEQMTEVMRWCNLAIAPASSIAYEICSVKMGFISGYYTDNQLGILNGLDQKGSAINVGNFKDLTGKKLTLATEKCLTNSTLKNMLKNQQLMIDGNSPTRLLNLFKNLC